MTAQSIDGKWKCVSSTPMGDQHSVMDLKCDGAIVTGTSTTELESVQIEEGAFDGRVFTWKMKMTEPLKMNLSGEVVVSGNTLEGAIGAGFFGKSELTGTREP